MNRLPYFSLFKASQRPIDASHSWTQQKTKTTPLSDCPLTFSNFPYIRTQRTHFFSVLPDLICILGTIPPLLIITFCQFQVYYFWLLIALLNPIMALYPAHLETNTSTPPTGFNPKPPQQGPPIPLFRNT